MGAPIQILQRILFILEFSRIFRVINLVIVTSSLRIAAKPFRTPFIFSCNFIPQAAVFRALAFIPMHMANVATPVVARRKTRLAERDIKIGDRVQLISGVLAGLVGEVVRCEKHRYYLLGVPNASSGILVRILRQRFRRLGARAA